MTRRPDETEDEWLAREQAAASKAAGGQHQAQIAPRNLAELSARLEATGTTLPPPRDEPRRYPRGGPLVDLVLEADLPKAMPLMVDGAEFKAEVGRASRDRVKGDPKPGTFSAIMDALWLRMTSSPGHIIRDRLAFIGKLAGYGRETARKCIRKAERVGLIATTPVMAWRDRVLRRAANWYFPVPDRPPGSPASAAPATGKRRRRPERNPSGWRSFILSTIARLHQRPRGFNTTPIRAHIRPAET